MKNSIVLLKIAGIINLMFLMFHLPFYWMFQWEHTLTCLTADTRNILLTMNIIANVLLIYFTFVLLRYNRIILQNAVGKAFLILVASFYIVRIFAEFYFWEFNGVQSWIITILCAIPAVCCLIPLFPKKNISYVSN